MPWPGASFRLRGTAGFRAGSHGDRSGPDLSRYAERCPRSHRTRRERADCEGPRSRLFGRGKRAAERSGKMATAFAGSAGNGTEALLERGKCAPGGRFARAFVRTEACASRFFSLRVAAMAAPE